MNSLRTTVRDIAARLGCSPNTVSLALKNDPRVKPSRAQLVRKVAEQMGYRPDPKLAQMMSHIATKGKRTFSKLGVLVGADFDRPDPWRAKRGVELGFDRFYEGMSRRMYELGYEFDCFWLGQPKMSAARVRQIILHRGIEGLIVFSYGSAPAVINFDFSGFAASVIGRGLAHPRLDACGANLHNDLDCVVRNALRLGYRRIGLALPEAAAARSLHCWEAAYQFYQSTLRPRDRLQVCVFDPGNAKPLLRWIRSEVPDCVIGLATTYEVLRSAGRADYRTLGFATLIAEPRLPEMAGINLPHHLIASKAVDVVVERLRSNRVGLPERPELTLFDGEWYDGPSLPPRVSS